MGNKEETTKNKKQDFQKKNSLLEWKKKYEEENDVTLNYKAIAQRLSKTPAEAVSEQQIASFFEGTIDLKDSDSLYLKLENYCQSKGLKIESTFNYYKFVKENLFNWRKKYEEENGPLDEEAIAKKMHDTFGLNPSKQKIHAMFSQTPDNKSPREVQLAELVALATLLNIPLEEICAIPFASEDSLHLAGGPVQQLDNFFYGGTYWGYYFKRKYQPDHLSPVIEHSIEEVELKIEIKDYQTVLTVTEKNEDKTFYGKPLTSFVLTGNLHHFVNKNMAYAFIKDKENRRAMGILFSYINLSADIRYYVTAAVMSFSLNQVHEPLFHKMCIFRVRQDCNNPIIKGVLSLNTGPLVFDQETLSELKQDEELKKLFDSVPETPCYAFLENALYSNSFSVSDNVQKTKNILTLRKNSLLPFHQFVSESDSFSNFMKDFQKFEECENIKSSSDIPTRGRPRKIETSLDMNMVDMHTFNYNKYVKLNLNKWFGDFKAEKKTTLTIAGITEKLNTLKINTTYKRVDAMFKMNDTQVNLPEVIALCQAYNIPFQKIAAFPITPAISIDHMLGEGIQPLNNDFYIGKYWCYYFEPKHDDDQFQMLESMQLKEAVLEIKREENYTFVTLAEVDEKDKFAKAPVPSPKLEGRLHHLTNPDICYSLITSKNAERTMLLEFSYINLSSDIRYYMTMGMCTFSKGTHPAPFYEKMAVFKERQYPSTDPENDTLIRGILSLNTGPIIIKEDTLKELSAKNPEIKNIASPSKAQLKCYAYTENDIKIGLSFIKDDAKRIEKLLTLRANSLQPVHEIVSERDSFADFTKKYQQNQRGKH